MAPIAPADRMCVSCEVEDGKYKCPRCMKYTCSLACSKKHKEEHPAEEEKAPASQPAQVPSADDISGTEQLDDFGKIFAKYPVLATYLNQIADETEPPSSSTALDSNNGPDNGNSYNNNNYNKRKQQSRKPWTREIGMQNGLHKLRQLRDQDRSGALQEFCELVHILNAQKADEEARRLDAQRDAEMIGQLIREERDKRDQ